MKHEEWMEEDERKAAPAVVRPTLDSIKLRADEARAVIAHHQEMMKHHAGRGAHEELRRHMARVEEIWKAMPPSPMF